MDINVPWQQRMNLKKLWISTTKIFTMKVIAKIKQDKKKDREDKKTMNAKEESVGISYTFFNNIQQRKSA